MTAAYSSPSTINSDQTVLVTARSVLDSTKVAQAAVSLLRTVTVSVSPSNVYLRPSESQQFSATVGGASNTAVTWQVDPTVGTLSPNGLYTAPASVLSEQTVAVTATRQTRRPTLGYWPVSCSGSAWESAGSIVPPCRPLLTPDVQG